MRNCFCQREQLSQFEESVPFEAFCSKCKPIIAKTANSMKIGNITIREVTQYYDEDICEVTEYRFGESSKIYFYTTSSFEMIEGQLMGHVVLSERHGIKQILCICPKFILIHRMRINNIDSYILLFTQTNKFIDISDIKSDNDIVMGYIKIPLSSYYKSGKLYIKYFDVGIEKMEAFTI